MRVGDKTGTFGEQANDVAIAWPPHRPPVIVTANLAEFKVSPDDRNKALANVERAAAALI